MCVPGKNTTASTEQQTGVGGAPGTSAHRNNDDARQGRARTTALLAQAFLVMVLTVTCVVQNLPHTGVCDTHPVGIHTELVVFGLTGRLLLCTAQPAHSACACCIPRACARALYPHTTCLFQVMHAVRAGGWRA